MTKNYTKYILIIAFLFSCTGYLSAQSAAFLNIAPDARTAAMGGASLAVPSNTYAVFNNMAGSVFSEKKLSVGVSYLRWQPDMSDNNLLTAAACGQLGKKMALALGVRYFTYKEVAVFDNNGMEKGASKPKEMSFDLGYSYKIMKYLSASATLRYISSDMGKYYDANNAEQTARGSAFAADLGIMFDFHRFNVALSYGNLGSKIDYGFSKYSLPSAVRLGGAYSLSFGKNTFIPTVELDYYTGDNSCVAGGIGAELYLINIVGIRAGYHFGDEEKTIPNYASVGLGIKLFGFSLDAAYLIAGSASPLKNTMSFSLGYSF